MKNWILLISLIVSCSSIRAQTYIGDQVFTDDIQTTYLTCWKPAPGETAKIRFSLWGYRSLGDDSMNNLIEIEYFTATPGEMHDFLSGVVKFSGTYGSRLAETTVAGVKVKTFRYPVLGYYTGVYEPEGRIFCMYKTGKWKSILDAFVSYCSGNSIKQE